MPTVMTRVTSLHRVDHLVVDTEIARGDGRAYRAACGAVFLPAAMTEPSRRVCAPCLAAL